MSIPTYTCINTLAHEATLRGYMLKSVRVAISIAPTPPQYVPVKRLRPRILMIAHTLYIYVYIVRLASGGNGTVKHAAPLIR